MTTIYLVRHGLVENPGRVFYGPAFPLSEIGQRQIRLLVEDFRQAEIFPARILSSPYVRVQQSAALFSEAFGLPVETDERLREWDVDGWFGKPLDAFYAATGYASFPPRVDDLQVEPLDAMADRVVAVLQDIVQRTDGKPVLVISHREPMVSALLKLQHLPWDGIHDVAFPVASAWEASFDDAGKLVRAAQRFDRHATR